jgi:hypothetical protein
MGDWDLYLYLLVAVPFCLYTFPLKISLSTIAAGAAIIYFLLLDSRSKKQGPML